jgi:SH3-like domain-containing protein
MKGVAPLRLAALVVLASAPLAALGAAAVEFRAVAAPVAILYEGPSARSPRLSVVNRGYPLEVIVALEDWTKVRDATGAMAWVETPRLTAERTVLVRVPLAQVRERPDDSAPIAFQAREHVILELIERGSGGWVQVRHPTAGTGFVRLQQIWGA